MKKIFTILYLVLPISLFAQSLNENPYLTYYLGSNHQESSLGTILGRTYDGISKGHLSRNIPSAWVSSYSLNHLPTSARYSDFITPFGRSFMIVGSGSPKTTSLNFMGSVHGEMDASAVLKYNLDRSRKLNTSLLLNYHSYKGNEDQNEDTFLDLPQKQKFIGINNWFYRNKNFKSNLTAYHLMLDEIGGQTTFNKDTDYLTNNAYGTGTKLNHTGVAIQNNWVINDKESKLFKGMFFLDGELRLSDLTQFYGLNEYKGKETHLNAYAGYKLSKGFTNWEFGAHFRNEKLEESFADSQLTNFNVSIPGIYTRVETQFGYRVKLLADIRANYHSDNQFLIHPGLKLTYVPAKGMAISAFTGNGTRYARTFTENSRFFFSNREISIPEQLNPEQAWHYGISYRWTSNKWTELTYNWNIGGFTYYMLFYHNIYQNQNTVDISDNNLLVFRNHTARAFKTSLNNRMSFSPFKNTNVTFMHRYDVYKLDNNGEMSDKLYHPRNTFMFSMNYNFQQYVSLNTQVHVVGKTPASTQAYADGFAPKRKRWDMNVSVPLERYFGGFDAFKKFNVILGMDNITGNKMDDVVLHSENPFSSEMDAGITNGSALGSRFYGGIRVDF